MPCIKSCTRLYMTSTWGWLSKRSRLCTTRCKWCKPYKVSHYRHSKRYSRSWKHFRITRCRLVPGKSSSRLTQDPAINISQRLQARSARRSNGTNIWLSRWRHKVFNRERVEIKDCWEGWCPRPQNLPKPKISIHYSSSRWSKNSSKELAHNFIEFRLKFSII